MTLYLTHSSGSKIFDLVISGCQQRLIVSVVRQVNASRPGLEVRNWMTWRWVMGSPPASVWDACHHSYHDDW